MRSLAPVILAAVGLALGATAPAPAQAAYTPCPGAFTMTVGARHWKIDRVRRSLVSCTRARTVARRCMSTRHCPATWKQRVDFVAGRPNVWWHTAWSYDEAAPVAMVQWRARRA